MIKLDRPFDFGAVIRRARPRLWRDVRPISTGIAFGVLFLGDVAICGVPPCGWSAIGNGNSIDNGVNTIELFEESGTTDVYIGGSFFSINGQPLGSVARWNGSQWAAVGSGFNNWLQGLHALDFAGQRALYASGWFEFSGAVRVNHVARWSGTQWTGMADGFEGPNSPDWVHEMIVHDDGSGPAIYASGTFTSASGISMLHVARWNGTVWAPVGAGLNQAVNDLAIFDDGSGPKLFAVGSFSASGGTPVNQFACWDGTSWSNAGTSFLGSSPVALQVIDTPAGPRLAVGGWFSGVAGTADTAGIALWSGSDWTSIGSVTGGTPPRVVDMEYHDDGSGAALYIGGVFSGVGGTGASNIARWDGQAWTGLGSGTNDQVWAISSDGATPDAQGVLYVGGRFTMAGGVAASRVARWVGPRGRCAVDLNEDCTLDFFDIQTFLTWFVAQDARAQFVADDQFDFFDVLAYLTAFAAGCT